MGGLCSIDNLLPLMAISSAISLMKWLDPAPAVRVKEQVSLLITGDCGTNKAIRRENLKKKTKEKNNYWNSGAQDNCVNCWFTKKNPFLLD